MSIDITQLQPTIDQIKHIDETIKDLQERRELLKQTIIEALAGEDEGTINGATVIKYSTHMQSRFDTTAFKEANTDLYLRYTKVSPVTRFTIVQQDEAL